MLGASWGRLGESWSVLGCLGASSGRPGDVLGSSWGHLGDVLGTFWDAWWASLGALWGTLGWLGASSGQLGGVRTKSHETRKILKNHWFYSIREPLGCRGGVLKRLVSAEKHLGEVFRTSRDGLERLRSILGGMLERQGENH